ncbi:MAG: hypothetical protein QOE36_305, partial [Gaiellaceae bacterium]|nr:hypothetical protein [Gaiellaceae bacterium]
MSTLSPAVRAARHTGGGLFVPAVLVVAAIGVGALGSLQPLYGIAFVLAAAIVLLVTTNVSALPVLLVVTMFAEGVSVGPLTIGRLAGAFSLVVVVLVLLARGRAGLRGGPLLALVGAYGFWNLLSIYWAQDSSAVYTTQISWVIAITYMLAFALLIRTERQLMTIFATIAIGSLVFGLISFFTYVAAGGGAARSHGLDADPNYFAVYQVASLPAALALAAHERRRGRQLFYYGIVGVILLSVVSSLSRTGTVALLGVAAATLVVPWRMFFRRASDKVNYAIALAVGGSAAVAIGSTAFVSRLQAVLDPTKAAEDKGTGRTDLWAAALHGWHDHPWLGLGAGNFGSRALELLQTTPGVDTQKNYVSAGRVVHDAYLETLVELGPVGLAVFLGILTLTAWYLIRSFRRARSAGNANLERLSTALLASFLGYLLGAIFLSNQLGKLLWILIGLTLALDAVTRRLPAAAPGVRLAAARGASLRVPGRPVRAARAGPVQRPGMPFPGPERPDEREYDQEVSEQLVEQLERRIAEQMEALVAEQERLARRRATLAARETDLRQRRRELEDRERHASRFVDRETVLLERERELMHLAQSLADREREVETRSRVLGQVAQAASSQEETLVERQRRIDELDATLAARSLELEQLAAQLEARTTALVEHERAVAVTVAGAAELEERAHLVAAREQELAAQAAEIVEVRERVTALELKLQARAAELDAQATRLEEREREQVRSLTEHSSNLERELGRRLEEMTSRAQDLARSETELEARVRELEAERKTMAEAAERREAAAAAREERATQLEEALAGGTAELEAARSELGAERQAIAEREQRLEEERTALKAQRDTLEREERERAKAAKRRRSTESELEKQAEQVAERARELDQAQAALAAERERLERQTSEREQAIAAERALLEQEATERAEALAAERARLEQESSERASVHQKAEQSRTELAKRAEVLEARARELEALDAQAARHSEALAAQERELSARAARLEEAAQEHE